MPSTKNTRMARAAAPYTDRFGVEHPAVREKSWRPGYITTPNETTAERTARRAEDDGPVKEISFSSAPE